jgi:hypothetical protein
LNELEIRAALEELFIHVAAMPWADTSFTRSTVAKQAAKDQILDITLHKIIRLNNSINGEKRNGKQA